jgi:hypothetical protein
MFWNKGKSPRKMHLLYALNIKENPAVNFEGLNQQVEEKNQNFEC